jgi:hypothetical protein
LSKYLGWANTKSPGRSDWIEFVMDALPGGDPRLFRVNLSFMTSNWNCTFGSCPGILVEGAMTDVSCCQIGVHFGLHEGPEEKLAEFTRIKHRVHELTAEDWDHGPGKYYSDSYWATFTRGKRGQPRMIPEQTKVVDGGCIFANRHGGAAGKPGCAFHVLAQRTGRHHSETKPDVCWMIPFAISPPNFDDDVEMDVVTITGTPAAMWGSHDTEQTELPGHWCTEIPDHYTGANPVYVSAEVELRKMLTDEVYERMAKEIELAGPRRYPMPGELVGGGRKMLPLLVKVRGQQWMEEGQTDKVATAVKWLDTYDK